MRAKMLLYLKALKALKALLAWRDFDGLPPESPEDPYADVREPRRRGPGGKSTAVAVAEPEERPLVRADGRRTSRVMISDDM